MRAWIVAFVVVTACKGESTQKQRAVKLVAPTVDTAAVLAADAAAPPFLIVLDDQGEARLVAAASWSDLDAGRIRAARSTPLGPLDRFLREEVALGKANVDSAKRWEDYSQTPLAFDEPPLGAEDDPPPPEEEEEEEKFDDGTEESGGANMAITLDEGKLAKKADERVHGTYRMKRFPEDPQLARQQAIEQARAAGILDTTPAGTFSSAYPSTIYEPSSYPSRRASSAGAVVMGPLTSSAMILVAPTAKAARLIEAVRDTRHAIAVSHAGKLRPLRIQFGLDSWRSIDEWVEVRVAATKIVVEAVPETTIEVATLAELPAALEQARGSRTLDLDAPVDVLVDPDVDAQRFIEVLVAVDKAGARVIGIGPMPSPEDLAVRGKRIPRVTLGQPNAQGDLDRRLIRRTVKLNLPKVRACYETALRTDPSAKGTVYTQFFITPNGDVASSYANGVSPGLADCVAAAIKSLEFPKPKGGGGVQVNYPFTFHP